MRRFGVALSVDFGEGLSQPGGLQRGLVGGFGEVVVRHRPAGLPADLGRQFSERIGRIASQLIDLASLAGMARQDFCRSRGKVSARGRRDAPISCCSEDDAASRRLLPRWRCSFPSTIRCEASRTEHPRPGSALPSRGALPPTPSGSCLHEVCWYTRGAARQPPWPRR